eukprot:ANDGO_08342.mRNA.1 Glutathione S-transferase 1
MSTAPATSSSYKLTYFKGRGRAEIVRLVFAEAGVAYTDHRIEQEEWPALKASGYAPFGQLPVLEVDGVVYGQSIALARFVARRFHLLGNSDTDALKVDMIIDEASDIGSKLSEWYRAAADKKQEVVDDMVEKFLPMHIRYLNKLLGDNDYFLGSSFSLADIAIYNILEAVKNIAPAWEQIEGAGPILALVERVKSRPNIAKWIENRPASAF